ncbi:P-loop containing nucleoside triphosphate hydrolase protein [Elaphomyces granulatus]
MSFPTKDNLCTRFATELVLRRSSSPGVKISIIPDHNRSDSQKERLHAFSPSIDADTPNLSEVVQGAKEEMGLTSSNKVFSTDILRVELSGPTQPHLTMVDLPGFFKAGNREQSIEDAKTVKDLVLRYMKRPRSIILAVVSAKSDFALQEVTKYARKLDPRGERTLGLITKPDTLDAGSDSERAYVELAQNKDVKFRLGWHVLRNRSYDMRDATATERDEAEAQFFAQGIWTSLDPTQIGITTLKPRLSNVLKDQILLQLPSLLQDVESGIQECNGRLERLGDSRSTIEEQRRYLGRISHKFSSLMKAAVDGIYIDPFFGSAKTDEGYRRRLRAVVRNTLIGFEEDMRKHGQTRVIVEQAEDNRPNQISRSQFIDEVKSLMKRSGGRELPGMFNPLIVGELFSDQCRPWKGLADSITTRILQIAYETINELLQHVAVEETTDRILREIVNPEMETLKGDLEEKVKELLAPHYSGHPITYNHYLTENVQKAQAARRKREIETHLEKFLDISTFALSGYHINGGVDVGDLLNGLVQGTEADMERWASSTAIDYMEAYYKASPSIFPSD